MLENRVENHRARGSKGINAGRRSHCRVNDNNGEVILGNEREGMRKMV